MQQHLSTSTLIRNMMRTARTKNTTIMTVTITEKTADIKKMQGTPRMMSILIFLPFAKI